MLQFKNLGSGSSGNVTVVQAQSGTQVTRVLVDCGLGPRELERRLLQADLRLEDLDAIFVTHEHADHVGHTRSIAKRTGLPVWMSHGTWMACAGFEWGLAAEQCQIARDGQTIALGALELLPFTVPHDAREPLQLRCTDGDVSLGILTDLGHASSHVVQALQQCHALLMEANHDTDLLKKSSYPPFLKQRISGPLGHLSNQASADLLAQLLHPGLNLLVAAHLSERNNHPDLAVQAWAKVLHSAPQDILVADPEQGSPWLRVSRQH